MSETTISIVITAYNAARFLDQAIESALRQDHLDKEIIIVDDGSVDETTEIIHSYGTVLRSIRQENAGACSARNSGLSAAKGRYVKFLDADDVLAPGSLSREVAAARELPDEARSAVYEDVQWITEDGAPIQVRGVPPAPRSDDLATQIAWTIENAPLTSCPLHRRANLQAVGGFDSRTPRGQEHDLHVRLAIAGVRFVHVAGVAYCYRQHRGPRVSTQKASEIAAGWLAAGLRQVDLAANALDGPLPTEVARAFGRRFWRQGRELVQLGAADVAKPFFAAANQLSAEPNMVGSRLYQVVAGVVGPVWGERIGMAKVMLTSILSISGAWRNR